MKKQRAKTITFPRYTIERCEEWLRDLSPASHPDRIGLLTVMGYTNPTSMSAGSAVGAMKMYGLIQQNNSHYEMTPLGRALRMPVSESQQQAVRIVVFLKPDRFRELYTQFKGSRIKNPLFLRNLIGQQYGVTDKVARQFERVFLESGVLASVITIEEGGHILVKDIDPVLSNLGIEGGSFDPPSDIYNLTSGEIDVEKGIVSSSTEESSDFEQETLDPSLETSLKTVKTISDHKGSLGREAIPCHNLSLDKQIEALKVIVASYETNGLPANLPDISSVVGVSKKNIRTCYSFWESIGLLSENQEGWQPTPPLISFVTSMEWGIPTDAKKTLRIHLLQTWFGERIKLLSKVRKEISRDSLMDALGKKSGYPVGEGTNTKRLNILLQLLSLAGIIALENESNILRPEALDISVPAKPETSYVEKSETSDYSSAITENHDVIQFELDDGLYLIPKDELEKFIKKNGKRVSKQQFSLK